MMSNYQVHMIFVILIFNGVNCQYDYGNHAVQSALLSGPFPTYSRDYFVPRRAPMAVNRRQITLPRVAKVQKLQGLEGGCNCQYYYAQGGCRIYEGASEGQACHCSYIGFWTCHGNARPCTGSERCPAGCTSLSCCIMGRGNCMLQYFTFYLITCFI